VDSHEIFQILLMHASYGRAMLAAHHMELRLSTFLLCNAIERDEPATHESFKKLTLGRLVNEFVNRFDPSEELREELDNMVFFRNELAHRISDTICRAATDSGWREKVTKEMIEIERMFGETNVLLDPYMERLHRITKTTDADLRRITELAYPGIRVAD